jgi:carbamoyltransferase
MTAILGVSAYYHDSAAALVVDGTIVAAAQEERFSRKKHDEGFPAQAVAFCLERGGLTPRELDYVAFYDKPLLKFDRLLETYLAYAPRGFRSFREALPVWIRRKLHLSRRLRDALGGEYRRRFVFPEHHESHAASAFFPSPFEEAAVLTLDGVGEWATASVGVGRSNRVTILEEMHFPHSLGLLYSAFTYYCGFAVNSGEYKLMGLAPYGEPRYVDDILRHLVDLKADGSLRMDMAYFNYCEGLTMTSGRFHDLFGGPPRGADEPMTQRHMDLAASVQRVTEDVMLRAAEHAHKKTGSKNLCLAGGVALNCVGNGRILRESPFERVWIQPAAGDAAGALGAALLVWYQLLDKPRRPNPADDQRGSWLGPSYSDAEVQKFLEGTGAPHHVFDDDAAVCEAVVDELADGRVVGWFQDRMEFGPRALGARSLLGDPRDPRMQSVMNLKVKFRESFRPFAPAVLKERAADYFEMPAGEDDPYMLTVASVRAEHRRSPAEADTLDGAAQGLGRVNLVRSDIPAVTHVDYSARVQTVDSGRHGRYRELLSRFDARTGCPVLVNTSFNLGWDPIVCTPAEAYQTFMSSEIDALCLGRTLLLKREQPGWVAPERTDDLNVLLPSLACPVGDGGTLVADGDGIKCATCGRRYNVDDGVPQMFWPHEPLPTGVDPTEAVKAFYEKTPFPNYDDHDSLRSLIEKSRRGVYADELNRALPFNSTVLEVGCGTGQLSNFLGVSCRRVIGADMCLNSLRLAEQFRREHKLSRVRFVQMNLFRPPFRPGEFDVVLCNGVLHHTGDPRGGFEGLVPLVKPGGFIIVGLYNRYGRMLSGMRRRMFALSGGRGQWLDPYLRKTRLSTDKRRAWFEDQYRHPHESTHTVGEVLEWFERTGLDFVRAVPSTTGEPDFAGGLLTKTAPGTAFDHLREQVKQVASGNREGGFFLMIAQKPADSVGGRPGSRSTRHASVHAHAD